MTINIICSSRYKIEKKKIKSIVFEVINKKIGFSLSLLNIIFIGKRKMKAVANQYKNENVALPVLTFYYQEKNIGEIFICYPQMILLAAEKNKTVDYILNFLLNHAIENLVKQKSSIKE